MKQLSLISIIFSIFVMQNSFSMHLESEQPNCEKQDDIHREINSKIYEIQEKKQAQKPRNKKVFTEENIKLIIQKLAELKLQQEQN